MSNFKPLEISFPKLPVYEEAGNYSKPQIHGQKDINSSYEWDKPRHDPELHYSASQRIFERVTKHLEETRKFAKKERVKLDLQWENLEQQEQKLGEMFEKLNSFVKLNQDKRIRAQFVLQHERKNVFEKNQTIEKLETKTYNSVLKTKNEMEEQAAMLKHYEKFLYDVCKISSDFKTPFHIINRFESLLATKHNLAERQTNALEELEMARSKTSKMLEENRFKILGLNNIIANLNKRFSATMSKTFYWESVVINIKKYMLEKYQEINEVREACCNIYLLMCKRKHENPKINRNNLEKQLLYIKKTLYELEFVKNAMTNIKPCYRKNKYKNEKVVI